MKLLEGKFKKGGINQISDTNKPNFIPKATKSKKTININITLKKGNNL